MKPIRSVGWGQLDVSKGSPLYRYGPRITIDSFKYSLAKNSTYDDIIRRIQDSCNALTKLAHEVDEHDDELRRQDELREFLGRVSTSTHDTHTDVRPDPGDEKKRGFWCGLW